MGWAYASNSQIQSSGGGGGGLTISGWENQVFTRTTPFVSGGLTFTLAQNPILNALTVDYNGQRINETNWSVLGNVVTILFSDPDVAGYDIPPTFQFNYPY